MRKVPCDALHDWKPRKDQWSLWNYLQKGGLRAVMVAHRRWGKDDVALHWARIAGMERSGNYWHMLPEYGQARKAIWTAVNEDTGKRRIGEAFPHWTRKKIREQEMIIEFGKGSPWQLVGSDNYDSLVGASPVGIVFSEWAVANPQAWAYLSPILERNHGWALFIYTPRGTNHGLTMLKAAQTTPGWFGQCLPADKTPVFSSVQLESIRTNLVSIYGSEQGEALFRQEYFCSFEGAVFGAYYAKQLEAARIEGRIGSVPWAPGFEVDTWWDLGLEYLFHGNSRSAEHRDVRSETRGGFSSRHPLGQDHGPGEAILAGEPAEGSVGKGRGPSEGVPCSLLPSTCADRCALSVPVQWSTSGVEISIRSRRFLPPVPWGA